MAKKSKFIAFLEAAAIQLVTRIHDIWELAYVRPYDFASHLLEPAGRALAFRVKLLLFPSLAIPFILLIEERRRRSDNVLKALRRSILLFVTAYLVYVNSAGQMLQRLASIPFFAMIVISAATGIAFQLQRRSLVAPPGGRRRIEFRTIDPFPLSSGVSGQTGHVDAVRIQSRPRRGSGGRRSGDLAPAYPGVRWMVDGFLPMGTVWSEVAGMFAAAVFLTGWFLVIWKSSKLAAEALQKEIAGCD